VVEVGFELGVVEVGEDYEIAEVGHLIKETEGVLSEDYSG
jgi:hypothetical protein